MDIIYFQHGYYPNLAGAEPMLYQVAGLMRQRSHKVHIISQSSDQKIQVMDSDGIKIIKTPLLDLAVLQAHLDSVPDIVHTVDAIWLEYVQAAFNMAQEYEVPFAITPASAISTWHNIQETLSACRKAHAVFVLTKTERDAFTRDGVSEDKIHIIGQAPSLHGEPDPSWFRNIHQISGPMILYLSRKISFKGYKLLLAAMNEVWRTIANAHFVFIGPRIDPDSEATFARYADPRVTELGNVNELEKHSALAACDILCVPSTVDVFPLVYLEAWACGKPVITSTFPGVSDIISHGIDGLIANPSADAIADAILWLLNDDKRRIAMGAAGKYKVRGHFTWELVTDRVERVYQKLISSTSD